MAYQVVEKVVEVPHVQTVENIVEVPQVQVQEVVRHVPRVAAHSELCSSMSALLTRSDGSDRPRSIAVASARRYSGSAAA